MLGAYKPPIEGRRLRFSRVCMKPLVRSAFIDFTAIAVMALTGCGGGATPSSGPPTPPPAVSIAISPTSGNVQAGLTLQFTATISGTANTASTWQVNAVTGGTASTGTISSSGLYMAPAAIPSPATVTVTAISVADTSKSASAIVTITTPPVSVSVSPTTANVETLYTQQFSATVSNASNTSITWSVNGASGGSSTVGTITAIGLYTAPLRVPSPAIVTVTATSVADSTKSATAQVTVQAPPVPTGTWSYIGPDGASFATQLVADPNNAQTFYGAPSNGGLYKTTNAGSAWTQLVATTGVPVSLIVAPASGRLYIFSETQFQFSTNGGTTFSAAIPYPNNLDTETTGLTFAVDPKNDQTIYLLTSTSLQRSQDGGVTWTSLTVPPNAYLVSGVQAPTLGLLTVSAGNSSILMSASNSGFAISKDGGSTWQLQNTGMNTNFSALRQLVQDPVNPNRILCLGINPNGSSPTGNIYVSLDGGSTWTQQATASVYATLPQGQTGPGVYLAESTGLFETTNGGASYQTLVPAADSGAYTAVISPLSPNLIVYQGQDDIWVSQNGGQTWTMSETGIHARFMGQVAYAGATGPLYATTAFGTFFPQFWQANSTLSAWTQEYSGYSGLSVDQFDVDPLNGQHILGIEQPIFLNSPSSSELSTNGGGSWTPIPYAPAMQNEFQPFLFSEVHFGAANTNSAFACGEFGVARLSTASNTWAVVNNGLPSGAQCEALGVDRLTSGTLYAATNVGVYKSTDNGNNWSLLFQSSVSYSSVLVDPTNSKNVFVSGGTSVRSTDGGNTWIPMNVTGVMAMNPANPRLMYALNLRTLYASVDGGVTWATITPTINVLQFMDLTVTGSGQVVIPTQGTGVVTFTPN